MLIHTQAPSL